MYKPLGLAWFRLRTLDFMIKEASLKYPFETGGALMGYFSKDLAQLVVTHVIGPGPKAIHRRASFVPDLGYQLQEIAQHYTASGRVHTFLGDWHTHPEGILKLSIKDKRAMISVSGCRDARIDTPLMVILAGGNKWEVGAWQYLPTKLPLLHKKAFVAVPIRIHA